MKGHAHMNRYFIFLLIAAFLAGCAGHGRGHGRTGENIHTRLGAPTEGAVLLEEYPVLDAVLNSMATGDIKMLVIGEHTVSFGGESDSAAIAERLNIPLDVVQDYAAKNKTEATIEERFTVNVDYALLGDDDFDHIFSAEDNGGWDRFYRKYPKSAGYIQVSRPGFNAEKTLALVYVGNQRNWLSGGGEYVVLEKVDGVWKVKTRDTIWVS